jgi:hypothetical protein
MAARGPRQNLRRVDLATESGGLPGSLIRAIEADGGLWFAGDWYTPVDEIVRQARAAGAVGLRLDARNLSFIAELPDLRYLHVRTDGRPVLDPIADLQELQALILEVGAIRGDLDPFAFPELRWLRTGLGGKGAAKTRELLDRGHPNLEWLTVRETRARSVAELIGGFPRLRWASIGFADVLRSLGPIRERNSRLQGLSLYLTGIASLDGLDELPDLEVLELFGGHVADLGPVGRARGLRYARLLCPDAASIEPLRGHPRLRMLELKLSGEPDTTVLDSMPELVAVGRGKGFTVPIRQADLFEFPREDALRREWHDALRG